MCSVEIERRVVTGFLPHSLRAAKTLLMDSVENRKINIPGLAFSIMLLSTGYNFNVIHQCVSHVFDQYLLRTCTQTHSRAVAIWLLCCPSLSCCKSDGAVPSAAHGASKQSNPCVNICVATSRQGSQVYGSNMQMVCSYFRSCGWLFRM